MKLEVLPEDIDGAGGFPWSRNCPVARALIRCSGMKHAAASWTGAHLWNEEEFKEKRITFPHALTCIIAQYDKTGHMDPFGIEI